VEPQAIIAIISIFLLLLHHMDAKIRITEAPGLITTITIIDSTMSRITIRGVTTVGMIEDDRRESGVRILGRDEEDDPHTTVMMRSITALLGEVKSTSAILKVTA
jgi:hypothetical protein